MPSARLPMIPRRVPVYRNIKVHLQIANPSASSIPSAPATKLACVKNVSILVLVCAVSQLSVTSWTTRRIVCAPSDLLVIPTQNVHRLVRTKILFFNLLQCFMKPHTMISCTHTICLIVLVQEPETSPCVPTPCGPNALCKERNGAGQCTCLPDYTGNPYEGCRPECVVNSDCPSFQACMSFKCRDPCPGVCAPNAECTAINHQPTCSCQPGYTGDPFTYCTVPSKFFIIKINPKRKLIIRFNNKNKQQQQKNTHILIP